MRSKLWPALLVAVTLLRMHCMEWGRSTILVSEDQIGAWLPWYCEVRRAVLEGRLPFWNPCIYSGMPLYENLQAASLYPIHLLLCPLPPVTAQELILVIHELLAAAFVYAYARQLQLPPVAAFVAGGVFAWSGSMTAMVTTLPHFEAITWLPFCLWMWEKAESRPAQHLGVVAGLAMMILAGSPQVPLIAALTWVVLVFGPRAGQPRRLLSAVGRTMACALAAFGLTAVFWMPAADLLSMNVRVLLPNNTLGLSQALAPDAVPCVFFPQLSALGFNPPGFWYLGATGTLLALMGAGVAAPGGSARFWVLAAISLLVALGSSGLILPLVASWIPAVGMLRTWARFTVVLALAVGMLAGLGASRLVQRRPLLAYAAAAFVVLEMGWINAPETRPRSVLDVPPLLQAVRDPEMYRVGFVFPQVPIEALNWGMVTGSRNVAGFDPSCAWPYLELLWYVDYEGPAGSEWIGHLANHDNMVNLRHWDSPLIRLLDARYGYSLEKGSRTPVWTAIGSPLPRCWIVHEAIVEPDRPALFNRLRSPDFHPSRQVLLEAGSASHSDGRFGTVEVEADEAGFSLRATTDAPGYLVVSEAHYPGWRAEVDGKTAAIARADGALMAVYVPRGTHEIELWYEPRRFRLGLAISLVAAVILGLAGLRLRQASG